MLIDLSMEMRLIGMKMGRYMDKVIGLMVKSTMNGNHITKMDNYSYKTIMLTGFLEDYVKVGTNQGF